MGAAGLTKIMHHQHSFDTRGHQFLQCNRVIWLPGLSSCFGDGLCARSEDRAGEQERDNSPGC
jgi:hypothetical protein